MKIKWSLFLVSTIFVCMSNLRSYTEPLSTTDALNRRAPSLIGSSKLEEEKEEEYEVYLLKKRGKEPFEAARDFRRKIRAKKKKGGSKGKTEDKEKK